MATQLRVSAMTSWRGHLPATGQILLPILLRAAAGATEFSRAERILYTVCEFWAAIAARDLMTALGSDVKTNLQDAAIAFSTIGALQVAETLQAALGGLTDTPAKQRRRERLAALEADLLMTQDPVDQLIVRFATGLQGSSNEGPAYAS